MGDVLLKGRSNRPGASELTLVDGATDTGYTSLLEGRDFGNTEWEVLFSGPRGSQGARATGAVPQNRRLVLPLRVRGSTKDLLHDRLSALHMLADEFKRFSGGRLTWRAQGESYRQHFEIMSATVGLDWGKKRYDHSHFVDGVFSALCAPFLLGDAFDIADGFDTNTSADYTVDAAGGGLSVAGGQLVPTSTGTVRWRHSARGYAYGDVQATIKITTGSTVTSYDAHLFVNGSTVGLETFLSAQLFGGNLRLIKWAAGSQTVLNTTAFTVSANTTYWLRIRRQGMRLIAEVFTSEPTVLATPDATTATTLGAADHISYAKGHAGFRITVVSTAERYDDFIVEPYTYRSGLVLPDERQLRGSIPGDVPALADLVVGKGGASLAPIFAMFGWWPRAALANDCWNGDFEDDVDGWSVAAVSGVTGAATSIVRSTTAARNKYGAANGQVVCPATANVGTTFRLRRRYIQGRTYLILVWASSASQTTTARCRLGVSGDIASAGALALATTPKLYPALWTPTADRDSAYACMEITAATATTFNIDGVVVCEARPAVLSSGIAAPAATTADVSALPDDWPQAPFLAVLSAEDSSAVEIVRVESISGTTLTLTRGLEDTSAGTHSSGATVIPLPELRKHYEGAGASPPLGIIEAESADQGNLFTWAIQTSAGNYRLDDYLHAGDALSGAGSAFADWLVDPNLLVPDDFAGTELAVEVWARLRLHSGLVSPTAVLTLVPESATVASGVVTSWYGTKRYAEEYGSTGKVLAKPSPTAAFTRIYHLGTLRFTVDRSQSLRSRLGLKISWAAGTTGALCYADYLLLVPASARCLSPTGLADSPAESYPYFMEANGLKRIRSDLSGLIAEPTGDSRSYRDHGLGGSLLELPRGNVDCLLKLSTSIPDDPVPLTNEGLAYSDAALHLAITPRYAIARGSS